MKKLFLTIFSTLIASVLLIGTHAQTPNPGGRPVTDVLIPKPGKQGPRMPVIEITCHVQNGLMWFEYDSDAEGCLDITVTQRGTGSSINVVVCDNTPFAIPFNSGILDLSCYTESGEEYTGTILL